MSKNASRFLVVTHQFLVQDKNYLKKEKNLQKKWWFAECFPYLQEEAIKLQ
jgi:hypothetical protein